MSLPLRAVTTLLAAALVWTGCDRGEPGEIPRTREPVDVEVSHPVEAPATAAFPATATSTDEAELATRTSGTVRRVRVDVGSRVSRGDTLLELDATDVAAGIEAARASVEQARKRFDRIRSLEADGAATRQELDDARAALERARAELKRARGQSSYVVLRAPFTGTVSRRSADPGDLAVPGRPVLRLVRPGSVKIVADLPGRIAAGLEPGRTATVRDPDTGRGLSARVTRVAPDRQPGSRRVRVELRLEDGENGPPPPGSYLRLELQTDGSPALWIPRDAVVREGQLRGVFLLDGEDHLRLRWLQLGDERGPAVEVLDGLDSDARVVREPGPRLADGTPVESSTSVDWSPFGRETGR